MNKFKAVLAAGAAILILVFIAGRFASLAFPMIIIAILAVTIASAMRMSVGELIDAVKSFFRKK